MLAISDVLVPEAVFVRSVLFLSVRWVLPLFRFLSGRSTGKGYPVFVSCSEPGVQHRSRSGKGRGCKEQER